MGQGAESCGGYEHHYDAYDADNSNGYNEWRGSDGTVYVVSSMKSSHIRNCIRICDDLRLTATFSSESEQWSDWVQVFENELHTRNESLHVAATYTSPAAVKPQRGKKLELICFCGTHYSPRLSDIKRGYGKSCSKRCAAIKRDYGKRDPLCAVSGDTLSKILIKYQTQS